MDKNVQEKEKQVQVEADKDKADKDKVDKDKALQAKARLDQLKSSRGRAVRISIAAVAVAVVAICVCVLVFRGLGSRTTSAYVSLGDVTFIDKSRQGDEYFVTFQAAEYNCLPEELNENGVTIRINREIYDALALNVKYSAATVSFTVPVRIASRAGYREADGNLNALWREDILSEYGRVISLVW